MKKIIFAFALVAGLASCTKEASVATTENAQMSEISFVMEGDLDFTVTRAAAVTTLDSFNVLAENGTPAQVWSLTEVTKSGSNYNTGKMWPSTDQQYSFYASNISLSYNTAGTTVSPSNAETDVVVAYSAYSAANYRQAVPLTFNHIFARVGKVTIPAPAGYSIEVSEVKINGGTAGTYNLKDNAWTAKSEASYKALHVGDNDLYIVPNDCLISVTYTLTKGDYVKTFTKTGTVSIAQGQINNITATPTIVGDEGASDIVFTVSLTPWGSKDHSLDLN